MSDDYLKILFIEEDETDFLDTIMALADQVLCEVVHVQTTEQALLCLDRETYDIVLLDLPDRQSLQIIANLHRHSPDTALLILADYDDEEQVIAAVGQGAQGYLVRGHFDGATLIEYMRYAMAQHRHQLQLS